MSDTAETTKNKSKADIRILGVGGGGGNALETMIKEGIQGVKFTAVNTDSQALENSSAEHKIQLGAKLTKGLGAGADPEIGRRAGIESYEEIVKALQGADMLFVTAGMGGGTGTGAAPLVAQAADELGILTVGIVTKPFLFEGPKRMKQAEKGIRELRNYVDTLIVAPNEKLLHISQKTAPLLELFKVTDDVLLNAVKGIAELVSVPGLVNLDFADIRTVMMDKGLAIMGRGMAEGHDRAEKAVRSAVSSPLLSGLSIEGATGMIVNITADSSLSLMEVQSASSVLTAMADGDADIVVGAVIDESMGGRLSVTVIATGFDGKESSAPMPELFFSSRSSVPLEGPPRPFEAKTDGAQAASPNSRQTVAGTAVPAPRKEASLSSHKESCLTESLEQDSVLTEGKKPLSSEESLGARVVPSVAKKTPDSLPKVLPEFSHSPVGSRDRRPSAKPSENLKIPSDVSMKTVSDGDMPAPSFKPPHKDAPLASLSAEGGSAVAENKPQQKPLEDSYGLPSSDSFLRETPALAKGDTAEQDPLAQKEEQESLLPSSLGDSCASAKEAYSSSGETADRPFLPSDPLLEGGSSSSVGGPKTVLSKPEKNLNETGPSSSPGKADPGPLFSKEGLAKPPSDTALESAGPLTNEEDRAGSPGDSRGESFSPSLKNNESKKASPETEKPRPREILLEKIRTYTQSQKENLEAKALTENQLSMDWRESRFHKEASSPFEAALEFSDKEMGLK